MRGLYDVRTSAWKVSLHRNGTMGRSLASARGFHDAVLLLLLGGRSNFRDASTGTLHGVTEQPLLLAFRAARKKEDRRFAAAVMF